METSGALKAFVRDFELARTSLVYLGVKRVIHRAHMKELQGRQVEAGTGIVHRWMQENYADSMLIGLRRVLDKDTRTFSLTRLLRKLCEKHELFSWERYLQYSSNLEGGMDKQYLQMLYANFSKDGRTLDRAGIKADTEKLLADHKSILQYVNTVIAHHQNISEADSPTASPVIRWQDLDKLFDEVTGLFNKYYALVRPGVQVDFTPVLPAGFQRAFKKMIEPRENNEPLQVRGGEQPPRR